MSDKPTARRTTRRAKRSLDAASVAATEGPRFTAPLVVGVLADTHVFERGARQLPPEVPRLFARFGAGLILHAGDVHAPAVLDTLAEVAPVLAVRGNNDPAALGLPDRIDFDVGRFRFALVHGHQGRTANRAAARLAGRVDCVVYGHSHIPRSVLEDGTILFNPGSPTDRRWGPYFGIGVLTVTAERIEPELILFGHASELEEMTPVRAEEQAPTPTPPPLPSAGEGL